MKRHIFKDLDNALTWDIYPALDKKESNNTQAVNRINKYTETLNTWTDKGITDYIVDDELFGDFISSNIFEEYGDNVTCFAINSKNIPIGVAILSRSHMKGECNFEYLVVDSKYRGKGLGTRMINSVTKNIQEFLGYYKEIHTINAPVNKTNKASLKALSNNGYVYKKSLSTNPNFAILTCKPKENEFYK